MPPPARPHRRAGFTLIELLVVIAIIAIIMAILFPVFFSVKEKARQGTVMDSYQKIYAALGRYQTENHRSPDVLFGYAVAGQSMSQVKPVGSLYPLYINDRNVFTDPNNPVTDQTQTQAATVNTATGGTLTAAGQTFYTADAFDAGPMINADGTIGPTPVARYQRFWTAYPPPAGDANNPPTAPRELANTNPPADTFVTCTTYHAGKGIGQGKVLVLFEGGNVRTMDVSKFLAAEGGTDGPGTTNKFWEVTP